MTIGVNGYPNSVTHDSHMHLKPAQMDPLESLLMLHANHNQPSEPVRGAVADFMDVPDIKKRFNMMVGCWGEYGTPTDRQLYGILEIDYRAVTLHAINRITSSQTATKLVFKNGALQAKRLVIGRSLFGKDHREVASEPSDLWDEVTNPALVNRLLDAADIIFERVS